MNTTEDAFDASQCDAIREDLAAREWERTVNRIDAMRQALPVDDQVLSVLHPLQVLQGGQVVGGRSAWNALYHSLASLATLREVTAVAPEFESHLRAAAECLLPFIRKTPEVATGQIACMPNGAIGGALTPLGEAMREQARLRDDYNARNARLQNCSAMAQQCKLTNYLG